MKTITHDLPYDGNSIRIIPLADTHIGDNHCDMQRVLDIVSHIAQSSNTYTILDGDLMNTAIIGSKSDVYHDVMTPSEQLTTCAGIFGGIARQGKILAVLPGNHEERISRTTGVDMTHLLCRELGIEDVYSYTSALLFLRFGENLRKDPKKKMVYTIYVNHGHGGGRRAGSKINALEDAARIVTADVYLCGHTHNPAVFRQQHFVPNPGNCTVSRREQVFVNTASFLRWDGSYADRAGFTPASNELPVITLDPHKHKVTVTI